MGMMLLGALLALSGLVLGLLVATNVVATSATSWWEIISALATSIAAISAVGIAVWSWRREDTDRRARANIAWARARPDLAACLRATEVVANALTSMAFTGDGLKVRESAKYLLREHVNALTLNQCEAVISDLAHDHKERGLRVSGLIGDLPRIMRRCGTILGQVDCPGPGFDTHSIIVMSEVAEFGRRICDLLDKPPPRILSEGQVQEYAKLLGIVHLFHQP